MKLEWELHIHHDPLPFVRRHCKFFIFTFFNSFCTEYIVVNICGEISCCIVKPIHILYYAVLVLWYDVVLCGHCLDSKYYCEYWEDDEVCIVHHDYEYKCGNA